MNIGIWWGGSESGLAARPFATNSKLLVNPADEAATRSDFEPDVVVARCFSVLAVVSLSGAVIAMSPLCGPGEVRAEIQLAAGESLHDQHGGRAGRAAQSGYLWKIGRCTHTEQQAAAFECSSPSAVGEDAEVANANQTGGQNVQQEAAQELMSGNGHDLVLAAVSVVPPAEGDALVVEGHEPMVGDGHAMCVAGQVVENMFGAAERWLGVDHPILSM